jgi:hypothetical protein
MSLKYKPFSEPLHISAKYLFLNRERAPPSHRGVNVGAEMGYRLDEVLPS